MLVPFPVLDLLVVEASSARSHRRRHRPGRDHRE